MKIDNRFDNRAIRPCGLDGIALSARPVGDVLQGAAADCNTAAKTADFPRKIINLHRIMAVDKPPGQSGNAPGTLTTGPRHPYDTLPCHIEDNPPPTAAAIVALCLIGGAVLAFGLALWVLV